MPLTPNNREEHWLQGMVDGSTTLTPNNRKEHWYQAIINGSTNLEPNKRSEYWYKEIMESKGGGGGGGDLSIANVTIVNTTQNQLGYTWAVCYEENELFEGSPAMVWVGVQLEPNETEVVKMPLYKGTVVIEDYGGATISISGNITVLGGAYAITGDGTITLS